MLHGRLTDGIPKVLPEELVTTLGESGGARIERIVSHGHVSPRGFWYDQDEDEFVLVVQGGAKLQIAEHGELSLGPGDWVDLPARTRHRVSWTDPDCDTVWLAVFRER
jgi:cupin 2 domain-containing protein